MSYARQALSGHPSGVPGRAKMSKALTAWLLMVATVVSPTTPLKVVQSSVGHVVTLLRDPDLSRPVNAEKRRTEIRRVTESLFDFPEMARRALTRDWDVYPAREREEFTRLFTEMLEQSYVGKIQAHPGRIVYTGESIDKAYAAVRSKILTARQGEIPIEYRLYRVGMRWAVYDVMISGVSFVSSYRAQFDQVLQTEPFGGLLQKMRQADALAVMKPVR